MGRDRAVTERDESGFTAGQGAVFATCVVSVFFALPACRAAVGLLLGSVHAQDASWIEAPVLAAASLFGGAVAGNAISGRRGQFPFSMAFVVFPVAAAVFFGQSMVFHDNYRWRQYEHALDVALFNVAYPLAFAGMAWVSTIVIRRRQTTAWSAAAACALNGVVGGAIFSLATSLLPLGGRIEAIAFAASLAVAAFLSARRLSAVLTPTASDRH